MSEPTLPGKEWLERLLGLAAIASGVETRDAADCQWLVVSDADLSQDEVDALIGDRGSVLDSIQYLVNTVANLNVPEAEQTAYTVELNGYRVRREAELRQMADEVAERVRAEGEEVEIDGLSAAERRQVHTLFKEQSDLATESRGQEPHRKLVVRLK